MSNTDIHPTLGIIGGTGWPSTNIYMREIPRRVQERLGGLNTPNIAFQSRNFAKIDEWMHAGNWEAVTALLTEMAAQMANGNNIDSLVILSNTLHKVAPDVARSAGVPLIHIGECTAREVFKQGIDRVGFIGTKFTMREDFILEYFRELGIEVFTPPEESMDGIDDIIFNELCQGKFEDDSRDFLFLQAAKMVELHEIKGLILGCTELGLTITEDELIKFTSHNRHDLLKGGSYYGLAAIPIIDATECHIEAIVAYLCSHVR